MRRIFTILLATVALVGGILLVAQSPARGVTPAAPLQAEAPGAARAREIAAAVAPLEGIYAGQVQLGAVVKGRFSDALQTPAPQPTGAPELGAIDLSLFLRQNGSSVSGYVDLDTTLVFTRTGTIIQATPVGYPTGQPAPTLTPIRIGPEVTGTFDGTTLTLTSQEQKLNTNTGLALVRQFRIVAKLLPGKGQVFEGEYRETLTGFQDPNAVGGDRPLTAIGNVRLFSVLYLPREDTPTPTATSIGGPTSTATSRPPGDHALYLPLLQR